MQLTFLDCRRLLSVFGIIFQAVDTAPYDLSLAVSRPSNPAVMGTAVTAADKLG